MKIFVATKSYWPSSGGVQSVTKYLAEGLAKKGYHIEIVTSQEGADLQNETLNGVKIMRFHQKSFFKLHYGQKIEFQRYLIDNLTEEDTLITVCAQSFASEWVFPVLDCIKAKKIMYMHGMRDKKVNKKKTYSFKEFVKEMILTKWWNHYFLVNWKAIMKYDACIHLFKNDSSYSYFKENGFKPNFIIENSCENTFFEKKNNTDVLKMYGICNPYFIQVANYDTNKNQMFSMKSFVNADINNVDIVFIGSSDNGFVEKLREYKKKYEKKGCTIHILTGISREDTIYLVKNSFCSLISSYREYFPISLIEGMASGKPFISTAVGEIPKLPGGHVVSNEYEMSYWMEFYVNNKNYAEKLGEDAKNFAIKNLFLADKIEDFERIIKRTNERTIK